MKVPVLGEIQCLKIRGFKILQKHRVRQIEHDDAFRCNDVSKNVNGRHSAEEIKRECEVMMRASLSSQCDGSSVCNDDNIQQR